MLGLCFQNFDEVLVPSDHVSRSPNDTYYIDPDTVLRCHTSAHQAELLRQGQVAFLVTGGWLPFQMHHASLTCSECPYTRHPYSRHPSLPFPCASMLECAQSLHDRLCR